MSMMQGAPRRNMATSAWTTTTTRMCTCTVAILVGTYALSFVTFDIAVKTKYENQCLDYNYSNKNMYMDWWLDGKK